MIFALGEDQAMIREVVRRFARERVAPHAASWSSAGAVPDDVLDDLADLGIHSTTLGSLGAVETALVLEELAAADGSLALALASPAGAAGRASLGMCAAGAHAYPATRDGVFFARMAAVATGVARAALAAASAYAAERQQFGKPISAYQAIQFKLADMATRVDAARLMALHAATGDVAPGAAFRFATDAALFVTDEAVQIHGGYGYVREYAVERYYRDARWFALWVEE